MAQKGGQTVTFGTGVVPWRHDKPAWAKLAL
jgi:hypothetical protein